jgi:hypothetical protein
VYPLYIVLPVPQKSGDPLTHHILVGSYNKKMLTGHYQFRHY